MATLAEYNNNPGNIRPKKGVEYEGMLGVDDKGFAIFQNPEAGQNALVRDVKYKLGSGVNTPEKFVDKYAPASKENPEEARDNYKIYLAQQLGLKGTHDPFPEDSHTQVAKAVSSFEGGTWGGGDKSATSPTVIPPTLPPPAAAKPGTGTTEKEPDSLNPLIGAVVGAPIGAASGASAASYKAHMDAAQAAYDYAQAQRAAKAASAGASAAVPVAEALAEAPSSLIPTEAQHTRAFEGTQKGQGVTGRASQTTYNLRTQQIAEQAKEKARVIADLQRRGILPKSAPSLPGNVASTPAGVIAPTEAVEQMGALGKTAAAAEQVAPETSSFWKYLRGLGALPVKAALGGAGVGFGAVDVMNRVNAKDIPGAVISGLGTAAGLAAPYVASAGALPSAAIAAPLYLMGSDRIKHLKKHPEDFQLQEDRFDPLGMPIR